MSGRPPPLPPTCWATKLTKSPAFTFAVASLLTEAIRLTLGARFNHETKEGSRVLTVNRGSLNTFPLPVVVGTFRALNIEAHSISGKLSEDSFNPMANIQFDVTDDLMVYASFARGTKAGGFDVRSNSLPNSTTVARPGAFQFDSERADNIEAGLKYKGIFLQAEYYQRWLDEFDADGLLPVPEIKDTGFYVQGSFFPIKQKLEVYGITSQIYGDDDAGFGDSSEYGVGMTWYPYPTRTHRLNLQLLDVNKSPVSSTFGYYTGGQDGWTLASSFSIFF